MGSGSHSQIGRVLNGKLGSGFGQFFKANPGSEMAMAA
jgi:hypothetical protein